MTSPMRSARSDEPTASLAIARHGVYGAPHSTWEASPRHRGVPVTSQFMAGSFAPQRLNRKDKNTMALPDFSMRQLLEAGAHFGHQAHRWNPKMSAVHLRHPQQHPRDRSRRRRCRCSHRALQAISAIPSSRGGRVLFVGTKRQAAGFAIADAAKRSAQYYVNSRWLGGMLTNWKTISGLHPAPAQGRRDPRRRRHSGLTKKERLMLSREKREAREARSRRHQGHGRHARPDLRHRHQQGAAGDPGGQAPRHPGRRHRRHELRSGRHHLPGPGQ